MESLYRKYRPQTFADVVGQAHVVGTLERAVLEGRTSHAYLFCGPRGTGKTTMARIMAKALLCESGPGALPDGTCEQCRLVAEGSHPDVYELDAASRTGVDNVRDEIITRVDYAPVLGRCKIYIIDEVHMLSQAAFGALLKTIEEPPEHVVFILCTTDPQRIPNTVLSRVQRFDFHSLSEDEISSRLEYVCEQEGFTYDPDAIAIVAQHAQGGMRDALTTLEQLSVFGDGRISADAARDLLGEASSSALGEVVGALARRDVATLFSQVSQAVNEGRDLLQLTRELAARMRDVYVVAVAGAKEGLVSATGEALEALRAEAEAFGSPDRIARVLDILGDAATQMGTAPNQRLVLEIAFTRAARPQSDLTLESLAERVDALERALAGGASVQAPTPPAASVAAPAPAAPAVAAAAPAPAPAPEPTPHLAPRPTAPAVAAAAPAPAPAPEPTPHLAPRPTAQPAPRPEQRPMPASRPKPRPAPSSQPAPASGPKPQPAPQPAPKPQPAAIPEPAPQPAPQAAPAPRPAAPAASAQGASALQRGWRDVVDRLSSDSPWYASLLLNAVATSDDGNVIVVTLPRNSRFAMGMLARDDVRSAAEAAVGQVFGRRRLRFVEGDAAAQPAAPAAPQPQAVPAQAPAPVSAPAPNSAPAPQPAPQPAPAPTPQPAPAPMPMQQAPASAPAPDEEFVPYGDADVPFEEDLPPVDIPFEVPPDPAPAPQPVRQPVPQPQPASTPRPQPTPQPAPQPAPAPGPVPEEPADDAPAEPEPDIPESLAALLEDVFGPGVSVTIDGQGGSEADDAVADDVADVDETGSAADDSGCDIEGVVDGIDDFEDDDDSDEDD
jgi:DNA polymerase-3 subunit gamma/tau